ncbi:MAG: nitrilase-related carbon-nitrogen hydrolase, partial [Limisphaerales bacterium]
FAGFLPHKSGQRRRELERLGRIPGTLALYESPYRIERLLGELAEILPDRPVVLARELTKKFEEFLRGTASDLLERTRGRVWKGEFTVLVGPADSHPDGKVAAETADVVMSREGQGAESGAVTKARAAVSREQTLRLAVAQMLVEPGQPDRNLERAEAEIRRAAEAGAGIVLLPEVLDFGWTHPSALAGAGPIPDGATCRRLAAAAARHRVHVAAGLAERFGDRCFNAAVLLNPDGELLLHHRKIHEIPFARSLYATGDRLGVVETSLGRIGLMICADALAPGLVVTRTLAAMGAELILSPCAWAVPPDHDNAADPYGRLWLDHYGPVAREHGLWIAGCSNVGPVVAGEWSGWSCIGNSLVVGPEGEVVQRSPYGETAEDQSVLEIGRRDL